MSGLDQRERQAIVDALDRWRKVGPGPTLPDVLGNILGGHFAPKPEPPVRGPGDCILTDIPNDSQPQPDHLADVVALLEDARMDSDRDSATESYRAATVRALIDIAQTLRGIRTALEKRTKPNLGPFPPNVFGRAKP